MNTVHSCPYVFNVCTKIYVYNVPYIWYGFNTCIQKRNAISVPCLSWRFFVGPTIRNLVFHRTMWPFSIKSTNIPGNHGLVGDVTSQNFRLSRDATLVLPVGWRPYRHRLSWIQEGKQSAKQSVCKVLGLLGTAASKPSLLGRCICIATCFTVIGICLWEAILSHPTAGSTSLTTWSTQAALAASGTAFSARWRSAKGNTSSKCATLVFINWKCSVKLKEQGRIKRLKAKISMTSKPYLHVCPWWSTQREPWEVAWDKRTSTYEVWAKLKSWEPPGLLSLSAGPKLLGHHFAITCHQCNLAFSFDRSELRPSANQQGWKAQCERHSAFWNS